MDITVDDDLSTAELSESDCSMLKHDHENVVGFCQGHFYDLSRTFRTTSAGSRVNRGFMMIKAIPMLPALSYRVDMKRGILAS